MIPDLRRAFWIVAALALTACDAASWLPRHGARVIREVSVGEGYRLLEDPETLLVQLPAAANRPAPTGAEAWLPELDPSAADSATVVVLAESPEEALGAASRLARAGIQRIAVVRGGVAAWQAMREPIEDGADPASGSTGNP
jgi:rhodanese-related sulfurtransferase